MSKSTAASAVPAGWISTPLHPVGRADPTTLTAGRRAGRSGGPLSAAWVTVAVAARPGRGPGRRAVSARLVAPRRRGYRRPPPAPGRPGQPGRPAGRRRGGRGGAVGRVAWPARAVAPVATAVAAAGP